MNKKDRILMGVAWYRREQWPLLVKVSVDKDNLEDTYDEWVQNAENGVEQIRQAGHHPHKIEVDVEELVEWAKDQKRPIDGRARSAYSVHKLKELDEMNKLEPK